MKIKKLQEICKIKRIDLVFLSNQDPNIIYLTSQKPSHSFLLISKEKANLFISKLDKVEANKEFEVKTIPEEWKKDFFSNEIKKVGINKEFITVAFAEKLKEFYPKASFKDISNELKKLRETKEQKEVEIIRKACQITSDALKNFKENFSIEKFPTEKSIALHLENFFRNKGAKACFPTIVANGANSAVPHHVTSNKKLEEGFLLIDMGACYQNYCSDMTRMFYIGSPSKEELEKYNLLLNCQEGCLNQINPEKSLQEIDSFARKELGDFSSHFIHSLGHGVGVEIHEAPRLSPESTHKVTNNHIFTVEPGIYFPEKFGLRIEDTIYYNGKVEILTTFPKNLQLLPIKAKQGDLTTNLLN